MENTTDLHYEHPIIPLVPPNWADIKLSHHLLFKHVMKNSKLCKQLLETILSIKIKQLIYHDEEKEIDISLDSKGIRLDVYVDDDQGTVYNLEMQATNPKELPERSRYYQSMIDLNLIKKGANYSQLPKSFIIFICTFDLFGEDKWIYTFENTCSQNNNLFLNDGTTKIFLNANGKDSNVSDELKSFLLYLKEQTISSQFVSDLDFEVNKIKENKEWRHEYMTLYMYEQTYLREGLERGIEQGIEQGIELTFISMVRKKYAKNLTAIEIADILELELSYVHRIITLLQQFPEENDTSIAQRLLLKEESLL